MTATTNWNLDFENTRRTVGCQTNSVRYSIHRTHCLLFILFICFTAEEVRIDNGRALFWRWITEETNDDPLLMAYKIAFQMHIKCECDRNDVENFMETCPTTFRICASYGLKDHQSNSLRLLCAMEAAFVVEWNQKFVSIWSMPWWGCNLNVVVIRTQMPVYCRDISYLWRGHRTYNSRIIEFHMQTGTFPKLKTNRMWKLEFSPSRYGDAQLHTQTTTTISTSASLIVRMQAKQLSRHQQFSF